MENSFDLKNYFDQMGKAVSPYLQKSTGKEKLLFAELLDYVA